MEERDRRPVEADPSGIEEPHDVLAAEEFAMPTADDRYPRDPIGAPHDVLAAEEFAMPTREERFPRDPTGIAEPHDVLAAEEFAMPVGGDRGTSEGLRVRSLVTPLLLLAIAVLVLRRRRS
jgi:hypothetical protein